MQSVEGNSLLVDSSSAESSPVVSLDLQNHAESSQASRSSEEDVFLQSLNKSAIDMGVTLPDIPMDKRDFAATIALGIESIFGPSIRESSSSVEAALKSQERLCRNISKLKDELDKMLEKSPLPLMNQPASRLSNVHKRINTLSATLKGIQKRIDNMNHLIIIMTSSPYVTPSTSRPSSKSWSSGSSDVPKLNSSLLRTSDSASFNNLGSVLAPNRIKRTDMFPLMDRNDSSNLVSLILSRFQFLQSAESDDLASPSSNPMEVSSEFLQAQDSQSRKNSMHSSDGGGLRSDAKDKQHVENDG